MASNRDKSQICSPSPYEDISSTELKFITSTKNDFENKSMNGGFESHDNGKTMLEALDSSIVKEGFKLKGGANLIPLSQEPSITYQEIKNKYLLFISEKDYVKFIVKFMTKWVKDVYN